MLDKYTCTLQTNSGDCGTGVTTRSSASMSEAIYWAISQHSDCEMAAWGRLLAELIDLVTDSCDHMNGWELDEIEAACRDAREYVKDV